ncbi:phosphatidylcholine translocator ABCB4-like [Mauremys mutica]|uniref:phosphatidylcholine translocator ABCB4-like n=1 Tax=Mauremys mutica TaxID=74926 RepID=UPI001D166F7B|nr:phosphatidylcholine translocator ABCB4-like [Mauremys mutica]
MKDDFIHYTEKEPLSPKSASNGYYNPAFQHDEIPEQNSELQKNKKKKKNEESKEKMVGILKLFAYADWLDIILMIIGLIAAVANGTGLPLIFVVIGKMTNRFVTIGQAVNMSSAVMNSSSTCPVMPGLDIEAEMTRFAYYYVGIGFAVVILSTIQVWTFLTSAARQTARIRQKFFYAVLHQEIAWFDISKIGTLNTRLTE